MRQIVTFIDHLAFVPMSYPSANDESLDYTAIDVVEVVRELARLTENAILTDLGLIGLGRWGWAAMSINALDILATTSILARCHTRD